MRSALAFGLGVLTGVGLAIVGWYATLPLGLWLLYETTALLC